MSIFDENEKLKEDFVQHYGAWEAKSIWFGNGVKIIPEPFLETTIRWEKDSDATLIEKAIVKLCRFKENMENRCFITPPQMETVYGHPQLIWGIFKDSEEIF
jgi:hypothetical protein